jgi:hypothetical protein
MRYLLLAIAGLLLVAVTTGADAVAGGRQGLQQKTMEQCEYECYGGYHGDPMEYMYCMAHCLQGVFKDILQVV